MEKTRRFFFFWVSWMLPRLVSSCCILKIRLLSNPELVIIQLTFWYTLLGHFKQDFVVAMSIRTSVLFTGLKHCSTQYTPGPAG